MINADNIKKLQSELLKALSGNKIDSYKKEALEIKLDFLISSLVEPSHFHNFEYIMKWIEEKRAKREMIAKEIPIKDTKTWFTDEKTGNIHHDSRKFFSIVGMKASSKHREVEGWCQPILKQPEVGILGIVAKKFDGVLHFLMQGKDEPGNIEGVQISPTLQATKSNYTRVHKGKLPLFLDLFEDLESGKRRTLYKKLQSEEGGRFLQKHNLNVVIELNEKENVECPENFIWMTMYQVKRLMEYEDIINSCTRSIIACLP